MLLRWLSVSVLLAAVGISYGDQQTSFDSIVVGLGAAGAVAAATLARAGRRVLALEAAPRPGGRLLSVPLGDGLVELGAEWVHGTEQSIVYDTAIANNISLLEQEMSIQFKYSDGSDVDEITSSIILHAFEYIDHKTDTVQSIGEYVTNKLRKYISEKYPEKVDDKELIEPILLLLDLIVDSLEASTSWMDVNAASPYTAIGGHRYTSFHRHGFITFIELILNTYKNGPGLTNLDMKLNKEVTLIEWPQDPEQKVTVRCQDGSVYTADNVIVTVSLGVLKERHNSIFSPPLPEAKIAAIETVQMGILDKIIFTWPEPWWKDHHWTHFLWRLHDLKAIPSSDLWTTKIALTSKPMGSSNTVTLWISGDNSKMIETLPEAEVKTKALELLKRFMGPNVTIPEPTGMIRSQWFSNPWTRGAYSYDAMSAAERPSARADLAEPLADSAGRPRLLFAGEATNTLRYSTVHGAAETGQREAMRILQSSNKTD